jgi:hypothetical protein
MPVIFVIAPDWTLRTTVRAELRELGIDALGMESADEVGRAIAAGEMPSAILLEAVPQLASGPAVKQLVERVPTVLIASRTETIDLPAVAVVLYRPVRIGEIVEQLQKLLRQPRFP